MAKSRKKSFRQRFIKAHQEHFGMAIALWGALGFILTVGGAGWAARDTIIFRPEVVQLHASQAAEIAENRAAVQYFQQAQMANLYRELGVLEEKERRGKLNPGDVRKMEYIRKEIENLQNARQQKK